MKDTGLTYKPRNDDIMFVAGMHGNERLPVQALGENGIDFILGNPRAYERNVRYTEQDLNASFGLGDSSYEARRAGEILDQIPKDACAVDFHTTEKEPRPFAIVVDEKMIWLAARTGVERVVIMTHNIKEGHALINYRDGISVEAGMHESLKSYAATLEIVKNIRGGMWHPVAVYEVYGTLNEPGVYKNFTAHADGFIPVLANESAYERQGIFGLKAKRR